MVLIAAFVTLAIMYTVCAPLFQTELGPNREENDRRDLIIQKTKLLQSLRDLDLDYVTEKITREDYIAQKNALSHELGLVYATLDESTSDEHPVS